MRHHVGVDARDRGQGPHHQRLRHADPHLARQQLVEQVPLERRQRPPPAHDVLALRLGRLARAGPRAAPRSRRAAARRARRPRRARHRGAARASRRNRRPRAYDSSSSHGARPVVVLRPLAQQLRRQQPQQPPARQEEHRPGGVLRRRLPEVGLERRHLGVGGRRAVERGVEGGEALHPAYASSPCTRASMTPASRPRSAQVRASTSAYPCVASTRRAPVAAIVSSSAGQSA